MSLVPKPLFRDPVWDGAADPTLIWNRQEKSWWMFYTARRAWSPPVPGVGWVHGTDIGIASTADGGADWLYRGVAVGLREPGSSDTFWAPEIVDDGRAYHMYVSHIGGSPVAWSDHPRLIRHYVSEDLRNWAYRSTLDLHSDRVIDACVHRLPEGGHRMWFKDETDNHTYAADSADLSHWERVGCAVDVSEHEGPNVFELGGWFWMLVDEWAGLRILRSSDLQSWEPQGRILDGSGCGPDDAGNGLHADVVVCGDDAYVFYFTHPARTADDDETSHSFRRSSIQVARVRIVAGALVCDRDERLVAPILPVARPSVTDGSSGTGG